MTINNLGRKQFISAYNSQVAEENCIKNMEEDTEAEALEEY